MLSPTIASTRRSRRLPVIWIIPILALAIGAWLAWDTLSKQGPTIAITFDSAEGLQPGQSQLKYKDIVFGTVQSNFAKHHGLPLEAVMGGKETIYPEYEAKIRKAIADAAAARPSSK